MSRNYEAHLEDRRYDIDGVIDWRWLRGDNGAWDGPKNDWVTSHKARYFEHVKKFDVVIQAGGNCGMYPRLFAQYFKWVYTFEPDPLNFFNLVINNQLDNVVKFQAALGDVHGMIEIHRHSMSNVGMHQVHANPGAHIPQLRIDDLALADCDLIQLDIEGYEIFALKGAVETITKFRPVVVCEKPTDEVNKFFLKHKYEPVSNSHMDTIFKPI